jgi:phenylacetate-CoA ligase
MAAGLREAIPMAQGIRRPHEAVDFAAIERMYPPPPEYFETAYFEDRDTIERKQLARLIDKAWRTYQVPFHRNRWDAAGFHPSHIKTLDDLWKCPFYTIDDIRKSIDDHPPFGDTKVSRPSAR